MSSRQRQTGQLSDAAANLFDNIPNDPRWLPSKLCKAPEQLAKIEFKVTLPQAEGHAASGSAD
jgi:hypothetical protein